jgi:hypothetical protein
VFQPSVTYNFPSMKAPEASARIVGALASLVQPASPGVKEYISAVSAWPVQPETV